MSSTSSNNSNGSIPGSAVLTSTDIRKLLKLFACTHYRSKETDKRTATIESICHSLFSKDYPRHVVINNENGEFSDSYPSRMFIPELPEQPPPNRRSTCISDDVPSSRDHLADSRNSEPNNIANNGNNNNCCNKLDIDKLKNLMSGARIARCRARLPIPVMSYKNKYICRSATLSSGAEIYGRSMIDYYTTPANNNQCGGQYHTSKYVKTYENDEYVEAIGFEEESPPLPRSIAISDASQMFSKVRNQDIKLLKYFSVKHICDLMLEMKKVKFGMKVTSSEKADKENRYSDFNIISLPYPGCEFFREFRDNSYNAEGLVYNWNQNFVDAMLDLPNGDILSAMLKINFKDYRSWDVIKLTQNYIKTLLYFIRESDYSILIHCISGWDRTPLFISLLRLTLWADGEIHKSLNAIEIIYLTVAYDWFLFGHNLTDRLSKGEEIMFFCFQFLKFITDEQFSINYELPKRETESERQLRKISVDSYMNGDEFLLDSTVERSLSNFGGSLTSLSSNFSFPNAELAANKCDDTFASLSPCDLEKIRISSNDNLSDSPTEEMVSTLTSTDELIISNNSRKRSPIMTSTTTSNNSTTTTNTITPTTTININNNHFFYNINAGGGGGGGGGGGSSSSQTTESSFHSSTKPVEIPNANNKPVKCSNGDELINSLCRSDSWQFVSEAGSIRDNHNHLHFSSPDSITSLRKDSSNHSPLYGANGFSLTPEDGNVAIPSRLSRRKKRLQEVRSIFNSEYTSLNLNCNNGYRVNNLVDQIINPYYSTRATPE